MNGNLTEVLTPMQGGLFTLFCVVLPWALVLIADALRSRADRKRARRYAEALDYINRRAK